MNNVLYCDKKIVYVDHKMQISQHEGSKRDIKKFEGSICKYVTNIERWWEGVSMKIHPTNILYANARESIGEDKARVLLHLYLHFHRISSAFAFASLSFFGTFCYFFETRQIARIRGEWILSNLSIMIVEFPFCFVCFALDFSSRVELS